MSDTDTHLSEVDQEPGSRGGCGETIQDHIYAAGRNFASERLRKKWANAGSHHGHQENRLCGFMKAASGLQVNEKTLTMVQGVTCL